MVYILYIIKDFHPSYELRPEIEVKVFSSDSARLRAISIWQEENEIGLRKDMTSYHSPFVGKKVVAVNDFGNDERLLETDEKELIQ